MGNVEEGAKLRRILENAAGSPDASSESDWRIRREEGIGRDKRSVPEILETKLGPKLIICWEKYHFLTFYVVANWWEDNLGVVGMVGHSYVTPEEPEWERLIGYVGI